jgi:hypothetical protein
MPQITEKADLPDTPSTAFDLSLHRQQSIILAGSNLYVNAGMPPSLPTSSIKQTATDTASM